MLHDVLTCNIMKTYRATRLAFFPFVGALRHFSHRFSWGMVKSAGFLPFRGVPGI